MLTILDRNALLEALVNELDIPESHYETACERYKSIGRWLHRDDSLLRSLHPEVYPQGSFLFGTVIPPLWRGEYDLDLVSQVQVEKLAITQSDLKRMMGVEVCAYAERYSMAEAPKDGNRCWTLYYADGVSFHIDILPCVPEDVEVIEGLRRLGVAPELAARAVAITDRRNSNFEVVSRDWRSSNPRGLGDWFKRRAQPERLARVSAGGREERAIADVPSYRWKTPLQRAIQVMKRHRDVMFQRSQDLAPISMIITTLAGVAYQGEATLLEALVGIIDRMPFAVAPTGRRVANPVNPLEDFADRWATDPRLEENFLEWHTQLRADLSVLRFGDEGALPRRIKEAFDVNVPSPSHGQSSTAPSRRVVPARTVEISSPPKPWGTRV